MYEVASPSRQHALFELARDLSSTLELDEVARAFTTHAPGLTGGDAGIWLLHDRPRRLVPLTSGQTERPLEDDAPELAVIRSGRPLRTASLFILPLTVSDRPIGVIEVDGASVAQLASGGMQFWRTLGETVGASVENARRHAKLMAAESRFRSLVEQIPVVTYIDEAGSGAPIYCQPADRHRHGRPRRRSGSPAPTRWTDRLHPDDREAADAAYRRTVQTGEPFEFEYRVIDVAGRTRWFHDEAVAVSTDSGRPDEIHGVIYETTRRREAEQARQVSERALGEAEHGTGRWSSSCRLRSTSTRSTRRAPRSTTALRTTSSPGTRIPSGRPTPTSSARSSTRTTGGGCSTGSRRPGSTARPS